MKTQFVTALTLAASFAAALAGCSDTAEKPETSEETGASMEMDPHAGHKMAISDEEAAKKKAVLQVLIDRFDVKGCDGADVVGTMRRTEPSGAEMVVRAYQTSVSCSDEVKAALKSSGFSESEPGLYASEAVDGTSERVLIRVAEDGSAAGIEWEINQK
ncbi:MAG: hypothetical protein AAF559_08225 [Pseudomonadota bacterium]